jgi:hypothetical protein
MENTFDTLIVEIQKEGKSLVSLAINKNDIDVLTNVQGQTINEILGNIYETLVDTAQKHSTTNVE